MTALLPVPGLTTPARPKALKTVERVLDSGLRVIAIRRPSVPMVEVRLRIPFFSTKSTHLAQSSLLSGTILTGTADLDRTGLAIALGELGADLNVGVDPDRLLLSSSALASGLPALLGLYAQVLTGARYPTSEVAGERDRLLERITMARSQAGTIAGDALARRMAPDHPYGLTIPSADDVAATTAAQLRSLHARLIKPSQAVLVLVGDLSPARALDAVEAALADWTGAAAAAKHPRLAPITAAPLQIIDRPGSVQTSFRFGGDAVSRSDEQYPALQLANLAFGGYFSSRWIENIREEKGYSYSPRSSLDHLVQGSTFSLIADVATDVTAPAVLETFYELGRISSLPITAVELESVRQYAIGTLALSTSTQSGVASTVAALVAGGLDVDWLTSHPARLLKVTVDEVAEAAATYLAPRRLIGVAVGDAAAITGPLSGITEVE